MNDDIVVQKILKLLENNTAFIGYALNGGIGTKINVRNTETGKTIQALSINVDSSGEVLVVKDSNDGKYKAVTFKAAEQVTERIIQIRKTKPVDDKKIIEYTDSDIEAFYLFVKLIDTGSPVDTQLQSTWIRKGSSCTHFVGAYERCNYVAKETINGVSYTGLPYKPYTSLQDCLNDDLSRDAQTPHGTSDEQGFGSGYQIYTTSMTSINEQNLKDALTSHDEYYQTNFRKLFGYGTILDCTGSMYVQGWEFAYDSVKNKHFLQCDFSYLPGYTTECTLEMQQLGYCDSQGFVNSKTPPPGTPGVGSIDNSWAYTYGWVNLPYSFMYLRHFPYNYLNGSDAKGSFLVLKVNDDQVPQIPPGYIRWYPGCPSNLGEGGPYNGSGGNRFPDGLPKPKKRDMKLSTHKAEIWLGSSKKEEAIKLYELGASDLFSGMYNAFILAANETQIDRLKRANSTIPPTLEESLSHETFYKNWNKNIIDLRIDPRVWIYIINNIPVANYVYPNIDGVYSDPRNSSLQQIIDNLYNRTINLTVIDKKTIVIHLKLGLSPKNVLSNTDCKGNVGTFNYPTSANDLTPSQSWEYQKYITIKIKNWSIQSVTNNLDTTDIPNNKWNKNYIEKKYFTSFGNISSIGGVTELYSRDFVNRVLLQSISDTSSTALTSGNHYEQYNYNQAKTVSTNSSPNQIMTFFANSYFYLKKPTTSTDSFRKVLVSTTSWWGLWDKTTLDNTTKRLTTVVGYEKNAYQVVTNFGLSPNLDYISTSYNNTQVSSRTYFDYFSDRPLIYIPSTVKSIQSKLINIPPNSLNYYLSSRQKTLDKYGLNFFNGSGDTRWIEFNFNNRLDNKNISFLPLPSPFYNQENFSVFETFDSILANLSTNNGVYVSTGTRRLDTRRWFNVLWAQFIYDGFIKVDVNSYNNVEFIPPTNPSQYIKFTTSDNYANAEYPFVIYNPQNLETVLTPGTLDVTKQVKITKPTNVDLDPNMSFLVYLYPFCTVTKKTKEI